MSFVLSRFVDLNFGVECIPTLLKTQYPSEQDEGGRYYSGYDNQIHDISDSGRSYTGYSIWVSLPVTFSVDPFGSCNSLTESLGYLPRRMGLAGPFRSRKNSRNDLEHVGGLQAGISSYSDDTF